MNVKRGIRKYVTKLRDDLLIHIPENILVNLREQLYHQVFCSPELNELNDLESLVNEAPNLRRLQISNQGKSG